MIKIWGRNTSANVQKVMWAVGEIGLAHERIDIGGPFGKNREPAYLAMNPNGLVPTLEEEDGFLLWESNSIVRYLAAKHRASVLEPADLRARARASAWMDWQLSVPSAHTAGKARPRRDRRVEKEDNGGDRHSRRRSRQERLCRGRCLLLRRHSRRRHGQSLSPTRARAPAAAQFRALVRGNRRAASIQGSGRRRAAGVMTNYSAAARAARPCVDTM